MNLEIDRAASHDDRRTLRAALSVVLAMCCLSNVWYRGPFFGLVILVAAAPPALLLTFVLWRARVPQIVLVPIGLVGAFAISWALCAPPSTVQIFERYLGVSLPADVREFKRYDDCWGIDPYHCFRFKTGTAGAMSIVEGVPLTRNESPSRAGELYEHIAARDWWRPSELREPQSWRGSYGDWHVEMWYEEASKIAYLWVYSM